MPEDVYPLVVTQTTGRKVLVVQDYTFAKYLGRLQVSFDDEGEVISWSGNPILLDNSTAEGSATHIIIINAIIRVPTQNSEQNSMIFP